MMTTFCSFNNTKIHIPLTHYRRRGSRGISDIPRRLRFTKLTLYIEKRTLLIKKEKSVMQAKSLRFFISVTSSYIEKYFTLHYGLYNEINKSPFPYRHKCTVTRANLSETATSPASHFRMFSI
jgi:hypothetical protein